MESFKNPFDARIKAIDDVLEKRFGEAKTASDWQKRVEALEEEQKKTKDAGYDFSYYKSAIAQARKKKVETMDDGTLEEQLKKIKEFESLREEEDKILREKIEAETDEKKKEGLKKDRNKALAYYEKKINEIEEKIKPKNEEEFIKKISDIEERRSEKLQRLGVNKEGKTIADVTYFDSQLATAQRELDKLITAKTERPVQYVLEAGLKKIRTQRDIEIASHGTSSLSDILNDATKKFTVFVSDWRKFDSQKLKQARQWEARRASLDKLERDFGPAIEEVKKIPAFASEAQQIEDEVRAIIKEQKELVDDETNKTDGAQKSKPEASQSIDDLLKVMAIAQEGERVKKERETLQREKPIQFLVEDLINQLQKQRDTETLIDALYQFESSWQKIDERKPETEAEWALRRDALRALKMELLNAKKKLSDMKIVIDYSAIDNEIADADDFLAAAGKKDQQS